MAMRISLHDLRFFGGVQADSVGGRSLPLALCIPCITKCKMIMRNFHYFCVTRREYAQKCWKTKKNLLFLKEKFIFNQKSS